MLIAARDAQVNGFVYASSSSVYGDHKGLPKYEKDIGNCLSPYAVTKRINEIYADNFRRVYHFRNIGLRYFNVFGPRQDPNGAYAAVIPRWIAQLLKREECIIFGDGETSRDFCYVDNVVRANILGALACAEGRELPVAVNVAAARATSLLDLYQLIIHEIRTLTNTPVPSEPKLGPEREGDIKHSLADLTLVEEALGYQFGVDVAEGMARTVRWFVSRLQGLKTMPALPT